jgi:alkanesulfonate monooxygenase SsuD/methylene tetrahydromethanopterin reductase-like flavin-dependent oxidoreductase (luciferase family)
MLKVGVNLPSFGVDETAGVREHARHAEELGLESIWVGDHLIPVRPFLDSTMVLATAAAAAERLAALAEVGVHRVIAMPFPADRLRQSELLAETDRLLNA